MITVGNSPFKPCDTARLLAQRFVNRNDCYAVQTKAGYVKIDKPLTDEVLHAHLKGKITVGSYQLSKDNKVKWLAFDLDPEKLEDPEETARKILQVCFERKREPDSAERPRIWPHSVLLEASRYPDNSYHIWILFLLPVPAKVARWLGLRILELANLNPRKVEVFPKQTELTPERPYGNLVKLPLGKHQVVNKWSRFLDPLTFKPLPNTVLYEVVGLSFSEADLAKMMSFEEKKHVQATLNLPSNFKPLPNREEEGAVRFLLRYWKPGYRNRLEMCFLGFCIKKGVSRDSAYRIIDEVTRRSHDEERIDRLRLVDYHYKKRLNVPLKGSSGLRQLVRELKGRGLVKRAGED